MKVIAWYLPQFHEIPENNHWWGEGFTEWTNVKKSKQYHDQQYQPRVPLDHNYYNLLSDETKQWQIDMAKKNGVYGFCMHHYWFGEKMLLEKPVDQYLSNKSLDFPYSICWANADWLNGWFGNDDSILIKQKYGERSEWKKHFDYLLPHFLDERYIKIDGKPLFVLFFPENFKKRNEMFDYWQELAKQEGLPGLTVAYRESNNSDFDDSRADFCIQYPPSDIFGEKIQKIPGIIRRLIRLFTRIFKVNVTHLMDSIILKMTYEDFWNRLLSFPPRSKKSVPGVLVDWDNSPRRGRLGTYLRDASPLKFKKYLTKQIERARTVYKKDMMFVFAWNEWAEGGYLEPDEKFKYGYLEAIKEALVENDELEG